MLTLGTSAIVSSRIVRQLLLDNPMSQRAMQAVVFAFYFSWSRRHLVKVWVLQPTYPALRTGRLFSLADFRHVASRNNFFREGRLPYCHLSDFWLLYVSRLNCPMPIFFPLRFVFAYNSQGRSFGALCLKNKTLAWAPCFVKDPGH